MIVEMCRVRIMGERDALPHVIESLQDIGLLHLATPPQSDALMTYKLDERQERHRRYLRRAIQEVDYCVEELHIGQTQPQAEYAKCTLSDLSRWACLARRVSREVGRLKSTTAELEEERALILKYRSFLSGFEAVLAGDIKWSTAAVYTVMLQGEGADPVGKVREGLETAIGDRFELRSRVLPSGGTALLLIAPASTATEVERVLAEARVEDIPVPVSFGAVSLAPAAPRMLGRLSEIPAELAKVAEDRAELTRRYGSELLRARACIHDRLDELEAQPLSGVTRRAFVVEGWLPVAQRAEFNERLGDACGEALMVSERSEEEWEDDEAPVVLHNPRVFRPFEAVGSLLPLPRYGTIDPTPYVALFFPLFFGIMLGDVGYGIVFAALSYGLMRRSRHGSTLRQIALVGIACAVLSTFFGVLFGEFFGDLGHRWFDMPVVLFDRAEALQSMLIIAIGIGYVHILLGLGLGVRVARHHRRQAIGRGAMAVCVGLVPVTLLSMLRVIPAGVFVPSWVALGISVGILITAEGLIGLIELLSALGNVLSYARLMAIGTASVMLATVANEMSTLVPVAFLGTLIAVLFHGVNFILGLFAPTIHALRLHYVEFFGKFYSSGGKPYRPFAHWGSSYQPTA